METRRASVHLGTSGWTYDHWLDRFYPPEIPKKKWFEFYCSHFPTVELNASFYRIPKPAVVEGWEKRSPPGFVFSIKVSRLITHIKRLKNCRKEIDWFFTTFSGLRKKIGAYLFQLPPTLKFDGELLRDFIPQLPRDTPLVFEFRDSQWLNDETCAILDEYKAGFCIADRGDPATEKRVIGGLAYIRFHGYRVDYGGSYPDAVLRQWALWISAQRKKGITVFAYFNNDRDGFAVQNCLKLREMVGD
jgi:uncharacterized protein YecE (DUF72 family)